MSERARWSAGLLGLVAIGLLLGPRGALPALVVLLILAASALGLGLVLLRRDPTLATWPRGLAALLLGACTLSAALLYLGWLGLPPWLLVPSLWVLPAALTARAWLAWLREASRRLPRDRAGRLLAGALGLALIALLHYAALPAVDHDSRLYHLALPEQWLLRGSTAALPSLGMSFHPLLVEASYFAALVLGGYLGPKLLAWLWTALALGLAAVVGARLCEAPGPPRPADEPSSGHAAGGLATALLFASYPVCWVTGILTYNDLATAACQLASLEALLRHRRHRHAAPLVEAAAFAGFALATKYAAFPTLAGTAAAAVCLWAWPGRGPGARWHRPRLRTAAAALLLLALPVAPLLVRNAAQAGNPVHPVFARADAVDARAHELHARMTMRGNPGVGGFFRSQARALLEPEAFWPLQDPDPSWLPLWPAALVAPALGAGPAAAGAAAVAGTLGLGLFTRTARYHLAAPALLAALAVAWACRARRAGLRRGIAAGLIVLGLVNAWRAQSLQEALTTPAGFVLGRLSLEEHLARVKPQFVALLEADRVLPDEAVVLCVGEHRTLYLRRRAIAAADYDPSPLVLAWRRARAAGRGLADELRAAGVTHVLVNAEQAERFARIDHFRELGPEGWKEAVAALPLEGPLVAEPLSTVTLWRLGSASPGAAGAPERSGARNEPGGL